jgi:hypothetical protein
VFAHAWTDSGVVSVAQLTSWIGRPPIPLSSPLMYLAAASAPAATPGTGTGPPLGSSRPTFSGVPVSPGAGGKAAGDEDAPPPVDVAELQAASAASSAAADTVVTSRILDLSMRNFLSFQSSCVVLRRALAA